MNSVLQMDFAQTLDPEVLDWYRLTPEERWKESERLFQHYLEMGGSLDPEPDSQSPFSDVLLTSQSPSDGGTGLRAVRRSGV